MLLDFYLQHLTLLTWPCLLRQYTLLISSYLLTADYFFFCLPLNASGSAQYFFSHYIHSLSSLFSSFDLYHTNKQMIQKCVSNPAFFSKLSSPISKSLWDRSSCVFHGHFKQCPKLKSSSSP